MNTQVSLQQIELDCLKSLVAKEAQALVDLLDEQDTAPSPAPPQSNMQCFF